jgi:hypothetical protein
MRNKLKYIVGVVLLITVPHLSYGQYFQRLYDVDSSQDWGWNIFLQSDDNYVVLGGFLNSETRQWGLYNMQVSADGNTVLNKNIFQFDSASLYSGSPGETKTLPSGYLAPQTIQWPNPVTGYLYSAVGFIKYNATGDTVFKKTYTDTSVYYDLMAACAIMPDV